MYLWHFRTLSALLYLWLYGRFTSTPTYLPSHYRTARQVGGRAMPNRCRPGRVHGRLFVCVCRFHNAAIMRVINLGPGLLMQRPLAIPLGQLSTAPLANIQLIF